MFCQTCGKERIGEGKFCSNCGVNFPAISQKDDVSETSIYPALLAILLLFIALSSNSLAIGFFTFLRWVMMIIGAYYTYVIYRRKKKADLWVWIFAILAILFNPLVPVYLAKDTWQLIDFIVLVLFGVFLARRKSI